MINLPKLTGLAREIFLSKYAAPGELEWEDCVKRVVKHIAQAENGSQAKWESDFFDIISNMLFIPGGRVLASAGKPKSSMLNCFSLEPEDNAYSLGDLLKNVYLISVSGGGCGMNFSKIRPRGDNIQNMKYAAPGVVSEIRKIDAIGNEVLCGGGRRVALLAILNIEHPDILSFLSAKLDCKQLSNFNISIGITNDFIKAVEKNKEWVFKFNNKIYYVYEVDRISEDGEKKVIRLTALNDEDALGRAYAGYKKLFTDKFENPKKLEFKAIDLWSSIIDSARICGDPGFFNIDLVNSYTNVSYFERMNQTNPCGELGLSHGSSCCLGSVNLALMYNEKKNDVNWSKLANTIRIAVRFLDNIISINNYPLPLNKEASSRSRRIGLGVMGLHYLLIKMGYRYGSNDCLEFLERLFSTIRNEAYIASIELAKEKGSFPAFDAEKFLKEEFSKTLPQRIRRDIKKHGLRNALILTIPPTGTTSIIAGVSSGVEPIFAPVYKRSYRDPQDFSIWKYQIVVDKLFQEFYKNGNDIKHIIGAYDLTPEEHLSTQATIQKYICSSISKTINFPEDITTDKLSSIILEFISDLKGLTIYRRNSRGLEPLQVIDISNKKELDKIMQEAEVGSQSNDSCRNGKCDL